MIWSTIGSWALRNWLPILVTGAVVALYLYVSALRGGIEARDKEIEALKVEVSEVAAEAKRQADAFTVLKATMEDYQALVTEYVKRLENLMKQDNANKEAVNTTGTESDRNSPVVPFIREVLEKLCKLNPAHCVPLP